MIKRFLVGLLVITGMVFFGQGQSIALNLADIETPSEKAIQDFEPVEVLVSFQEGANPDTFEAWLNGQNITDRFTATENGMKAQLTRADGLRTLDEGENGSIKGKGRNFLNTYVGGAGHKKDRDRVKFYVKTGMVETVQDDKGVWFITGSDQVSLYYIFEAMGYAVAADRLWQMETYRRQGRGTLAEIFGPDQLPTDVFIRTIGYSDEELTQGFLNLEPDVQKVVKGYIAGINRRINEIRNDPSLLPFEFAALGAKLGTTFIPADWTHGDVLSWIAMLLRNFDPEALDTGQMDNAALYQNMVAQFGASGSAMFQDLRWTNDPEAQTYIVGGLTAAGAVVPEDVDNDDDFSEVAEQMKARCRDFKEKLKKIKAHVKMGSYAWVVSGDKTESGNPILYSGPQMGFSVPSIVMEGSLQAGGIDVSGMSVPGIPVIIIGRTPHHAWSMQVGHSHTTDYYLESPDSVFLHRYETIKVAGQNDVILPVFRTSHGPVVNPMPFDPTTYESDPANPIVAWKYVHWGYEFDTIGGFLKLGKATSMDEFGAAIENVGVSQHFCYADRDGNIAYWMSGRDPLRPAGEWRLPQGAAGIPLEWDADVLIQRSTDRNAARGFYGGWNNKTNPDYASGFNDPGTAYGPFHRSHVIYDYFEETISSPDGRLSFENLRDLALNIATTDSFGSGGNPWKFVANDFIAAVSDSESDEDRQAALDLMSDWDGHFVSGGPDFWAWGMDRADAWVLMDVWIRKVINMTFADELAVDDGSGNMVLKESKQILFNVLLHGLAGSESGIVNNYYWFQNVDSGAPQAADAIIVAALDFALAELGSRPWGVGARGLIEYNHLMLETVHTMPFSSRSTYAQCVEYGADGPVRIESMFPLGESGDIRVGAGGAPVYDPNFFSMTPVFDGFTHRPFPLFDK
ncbi:putative penicillin acylase precursor; contains small and large subunit [Desulforapulum autotrophicum HRM2]|uniref:Penicillin acylase contains small and large subunit n=1 Tax=Desulforapulum autotrophicum (strain ATCC 43914 / DSM 3382 / VKM B-1955 / HRM2) TaxID=177437 RepID=C0QH53_DESAH|nr:penicillin acylase family protein [Desulforapulum autotrophicum]ACN15702.1 putative penicillin acylase precursor; contains small and large subunit [Desulforapulum autotrophicum HRM2]